MAKVYWKFLVSYDDTNTIRSWFNRSPWQIGEWREVVGPLNLCYWGFHASQRAIDALRYIPGNIVAQVEGAGEQISDEDKTAFERMRLLRAWHWTSKASIEIAVAAAELVLPVWTEQYPDDDRPADAIAAVKAWLANPSGEAAEMAAKAASNANTAWAATWYASYITRYAARYAGKAAAETAAGVVGATIGADRATISIARDVITHAMSTTTHHAASLAIYDSIEAAMQTIIAGLEEVPHV